MLWKHYQLNDERAFHQQLKDFFLYFRDENIYLLNKCLKNAPFRDKTAIYQKSFEVQ